jgi:transcriptional regulator with XRE-family HTH domain
MLNHLKIRDIRENRGLTQQAAADIAEMPRPHWARLESGNRKNPSLKTLESIAAALGVTIGEIVTSENK